MLISLRLPLSYTGLSPDKITPLPGVHKLLHPAAKRFSVMESQSGGG